MQDFKAVDGNSGHVNISTAPFNSWKTFSQFMHPARLRPKPHRLPPKLCAGLDTAVEVVRKQCDDDLLDQVQKGVRPEIHLSILILLETINEVLNRIFRSEAVDLPLPPTHQFMQS